MTMDFLLLAIILACGDGDRVHSHPCEKQIRACVKREERAAIAAIERTIPKWHPPLLQTVILPEPDFRHFHKCVQPKKEPKREK